MTTTQEEPISALERDVDEQEWRREIVREMRPKLERIEVRSDSLENNHRWLIVGLLALILIAVIASTEQREYT